MESIIRKNSHLTDTEISLFVNDEKCDKLIKEKVKGHIYIAKCHVCSQKLKELEAFKTLLADKNNFKYDEELPTDCINMDRVDDFINRKLSRRDTLKFRKHLTVCDTCRELTSVLLKTDALTSLENEKEGKYQWIKHLNGVFQLSDTIVISRKVSNQSLECDGMAYRK
jgi:hypothetical protein